MVVGCNLPSVQTTTGRTRTKEREGNEMKEEYTTGKFGWTEKEHLTKQQQHKEIRAWLWLAFYLILWVGILTGIALIIKALK